MAITGKAGVDAVIEMDFSGNAKLMPSVLHPRGTIVVYGNASGEATIPTQFFLTNAITIQYIFVYELTQAERDAAVTAINRDAGEQDADEQRGADDAAERHRGGSRGGRAGQGVWATSWCQLTDEL